MNLRNPIRLAGALAATLALASCQRIEPPTPIPTADQWRRVQENLLDEAPTPQHVVGAEFDGQVRLIGWDVEPASVEVGDEATFTFYWEVLDTFDENWSIFVHLDSNTRQNLDHAAIQNLYPTMHWEAGQIIRDVVTTEIVDDTQPGAVRVLLGFFRGSDQRLTVTNPGSGTVQEDGRLLVGDFPVTWTAPTYEVAWATSPITVDGDDNEWARIARTSNWVDPVSGDPVSGLHSWAKLLRDETSLYVWMHARDLDIWSTLTSRDANLWEEEVLELYLDPGQDGRDYVELQLNPLNTVFDAHFDDPANRDLAAARQFTIEGLETAVSVSGTLDDRTDRDRRWTAEVRIPIASVPGLAEALDGNLPVGMNLYRYDRPEGEDPSMVAWSPVGAGTFHNPVRFGSLTFAAQPPRPAVQPGAVNGADNGAGSGEGVPTIARPNQLERPTRRPGITPQGRRNAVQPQANGNE